MTEPTYTHGHHESVLRSHRWRTVENSASYLAPLLRSGQSLLDVGCGPGTITVDLARRVAPGEAIGIDASEDVVQQATADAPDDVDVRFEVADLYRLPYDDAAFDVVHAHQVLQHLPHPVTALAELRRVCAPGGVVAARDADYATFSWFPLDPLLDRWLEVYSHVARRNRGEPDAGRRLLHWARAAGFDAVEPSASVWCFATPEDRAWWGGLWADRVTESALHHQAIDYGVATAAELGAIADAWRRWADHDDAWFSVVHGEVLCRS